MSGVATAVTAGIAGAGASIYGANQQAKGAKRAARLQQDQFRFINQQQQPFIRSGYGANSELMRLLGIGSDRGSYGTPKIMRDPSGNPTRMSENAAAGGEAPPDSEYGSLLRPFDAAAFSQYQDPGYLFRKQQGEQALLNSAAAGSGALTGSALKDLLMFNQDLASTEYGNAFNRYQTQQGNIFSRLAGIANMGQNAAAGVGAQGTALAGQAGQAYTNAGTALGAGTIGAGNALAGGAMDAFLLSRLLNNQGG